MRNLISRLFYIIQCKIVTFYSEVTFGLIGIMRTDLAEDLYMKSMFFLNGHHIEVLCQICSHYAYESKSIRCMTIFIAW